MRDRTMGETVRISFIGDIMCEKPLQRAYDRYGAAVFDRVFAQTRELSSPPESKNPTFASATRRL